MFGFKGIWQDLGAKESLNSDCFDKRKDDAREGGKDGESEKNMNPVNGLEDEWSEGKKTEKKM